MYSRLIYCSATSYYLWCYTWSIVIFNLDFHLLPHRGHSYLLNPTRFHQFSAQNHSRSLHHSLGQSQESWTQGLSTLMLTQPHLCSHLQQPSGLQLPRPRVPRIHGQPHLRADLSMFCPRLRAWSSQFLLGCHQNIFRASRENCARATSCLYPLYPWLHAQPL